MVQTLESQCLNLRCGVRCGVAKAPFTQAAENLELEPGFSHSHMQRFWNLFWLLECSYRTFVLSHGRERLHDTIISNTREWSTRSIHAFSDNGLLRQKVSQWAVVEQQQQRKRENLCLRLFNTKGRYSARTCAHWPRSLRRTGQNDWRNHLTKTQPGQTFIGKWEFTKLCDGSRETATSHNKKGYTCTNKFGKRPIIEQIFIDDRCSRKLFSTAVPNGQLQSHTQHASAHINDSMSSGVFSKQCETHSDPYPPPPSPPPGPTATHVFCQHLAADFSMVVWTVLTALWQHYTWSD